MKVFALVAALFVAGGVGFAVAAILGAYAAVDTGLFRIDVWTAEFWLLAPGNPAIGLGPNGKWLLEGIVAALLVLTGTLVLRISGGKQR